MVYNNLFRHLQEEKSHEQKKTEKKKKEYKAEEKRSSSQHITESKSRREESLSLDEILVTEMERILTKS